MRINPNKKIYLQSLTASVSIVGSQGFKPHKLDYERYKQTRERPVIAVTSQRGNEYLFIAPTHGYRKEKNVTTTNVAITLYKNTINCDKIKNRY